MLRLLLILTMARYLLIRADASPEMGMGHLMRCLALAEQWQQGGEPVIWVSAPLPERAQERLENSGIEILAIHSVPGSETDAQETIRWAEAKQAAWCVVDGYQFGGSYQATLKKAGLKLLWVDDYGHAGRYCADLVLNHGPGASQALYPNVSSQTHLLLGCSYALLRREFLPWRQWQRPPTGPARKVLVSLGGSDPGNITAMVLQAFQGKICADLEAVVVIGAGNPHRPAVAALAEAGRHHLFCDATNLAELMAQADLGVAGGGVTAMEMAFMGLPALLICLADNQLLNCQYLQSVGCAVYLGQARDLTSETVGCAIGALAANPTQRAVMSKQGRGLVDGLGAFRVWLNLKDQEVRLRPARESDARLIWEWANAPDVRRASFSSEPIPWESHVQWFVERMSSPQCRFWLATDTADVPFGMVRFDLAPRDAAISVSLARESRGRNLGPLLIWKACRQLFQEEPAVAEIRAWIKPENHASVKAFEKCGFELVAEGECKGQPVQLFRLLRAKIL